MCPCTAHEEDVADAEFEGLSTIKGLNGSASGTNLTPEISQSITNEECYGRWASFYSSMDELDRNAPWTTAETWWKTAWYETIKTIGKGGLYTTCDEIPRYSFDSTANRTTTTSSFSIVTSFTKTKKCFRKPDLDAPWVAREKYCDRPHTMPTSPGCSIGKAMCDEMWNSHYANGMVPLIDEVKRGSYKEDTFGYCPDRSTCQLEVGNEVVLIYWSPAGTSRRDICDIDSATEFDKSASLVSTQTFTTSAITFQGQDLYYRAGKFVTLVTTNWNTEASSSTWDETVVAEYTRPSVMYGNFTFVSPTVYIAHHAITASFLSEVVDVYSRRGHLASEWKSEVRSAGIVALQENEVYSWRPKDLNVGGDGLHYAQLVADGKFQPSFQEDIKSIPGEKVPLNFNNLPNPVPASVYYDARFEDCWGPQTHCQTITDDTYRPRLALKNDVWLRILPKQYSCERPLLFDPPIVLHSVDTIAPAVIAVKTKSNMAASSPTLRAYPGAANSAMLPAATDISKPEDGDSSLETGGRELPHRTHDQEGSQAGTVENIVGVYGQNGNRVGRVGGFGGVDGHEASVHDNNPSHKEGYRQSLILGGTRSNPRVAGKSLGVPGDVPMTTEIGPKQTNNQYKPGDKVGHHGAGTSIATRNSRRAVVDWDIFVVALCLCMIIL
jgi:hypothetical protein